ncbi:hypothetical protein LPB86_01740 [Pedobacter sp. MC2016-14]|uniref:hypothetical protein n=1 Tax=Pedobacter sp. MC2016-14 TaxID=2897327 RepID=UPI001E2A4A45|nr:hypothetical protein [Pedobacter sp. MC2016-14]MCD0486931.1 hypothetical protein [Pedobacter sp. MC2016-14]
MQYQYKAFGFPVQSEFELPALLPVYVPFSQLTKCIQIVRGTVPAQLQNPSLGENAVGSYNSTEAILSFPNIAKFYIERGHIIVVEPRGGNADTIAQMVYANCLIIALFQRNSILLHCSGVRVNEEEVILFAAPKMTGKSTLTVLLQQRGYVPFTDDTALITFNGNCCYAQASYPMLRLNEESILQQQIYDDADKKHTRSTLDEKSGFYFHEQFSTGKMKVAGLVFLEKAGDTLSVEKLQPIVAIPSLVANIYRREWLSTMKKQQLEIELLSKLGNHVPLWKAVRPVHNETFNEFAQLIEAEILQSSLKN